MARDSNWHFSLQKQISFEESQTLSQQPTSQLQPQKVQTEPSSHQVAVSRARVQGQHILQISTQTLAPQESADAAMADLVTTSSKLQSYQTHGHEAGVKYDVTELNWQ